MTITEQIRENAAQVREALGSNPSAYAAGIGPLEEIVELALSLAGAQPPTATSVDRRAA